MRAPPAVAVAAFLVHVSCAEPPHHDDCADVLTDMAYGTLTGRLERTLWEHGEVVAYVEAVVRAWEVQVTVYGGTNRAAPTETVVYRVVDKFDAEVPRDPDRVIPDDLGEP